jgi:DNA-binding PadR family transcriptional regulator
MEEDFKNFLRTRPGFLNDWRRYTHLKVPGLKKRIDEAYKDYKEQLADPLRNTFVKDYCFGNTVVGTYESIEGYNFKVKMDMEEELHGTVVELGNMGSGKTVQELGIIQQQLDRPNSNTNFLIFVNKLLPEQAVLLKNPRNAGKILFLDKSNLSIGDILPPTNVDPPLNWSYLAKNLSISTGAYFSLMIYTLRLFAEFNSYNYQTKNLYTFTKFVENRHEKELNDKNSKNILLSRLKGLMIELKPLFIKKRPLKDEIFLKNNLIICLDNNSKVLSQTVINIIVSRLIMLKSANPEYLQHKTIILISDGQGNISNLSRKNTQQTELDILEEVATTGRYLGLYWWLDLQVGSQLSDILLNSIEVAFIKQQNSLEECKAMMNILGLESLDIERLLHLAVDEAVFINRRYPDAHPILMKVPNFKTEILQREEIHKLQEGHIDKLLADIENAPEETTPNIKTENKDSIELTYHERLVMVNLKKNPFSTQEQRGILLDINKATVNKLLKKLESKGWVEKAEKINRGKGNSAFLPYLFTEKGKEKFGLQEFHGNGNLEHQYYQHITKQFFENLHKNCIATIEKQINENDSGDVFIKFEKQGKKVRMAVEIENSYNPNQILKNITKYHQIGLDKLFIAVYGADMKKKVHKIIANNKVATQWLTAEKIEVVSVTDFIIKEE